MDGTLGYYNAMDGKPLPPPKPELARAEPRGIQKGGETDLKLIGKNLTLATEVKFSDPKITGELHRDAGHEGELFVTVKAAPDLNRDSCEMWLASTNGETAKIKVFIDNLPQVF